MPNHTLAASLLMLADALPNLIAEFDGYVAQEIGPKLSCNEANALAAVIRAAGDDNLADYWLAAHGEGDENPDEVETDDEHWSLALSRRPVIDPARSL